MKKILTALVLLRAMAFAGSVDVSAGELSIHATPDGTAVISLQLQTTTNLIDGIWKNAGEPVRWEVPTDKSELYRVQATGEHEMDNYTPANTANLNRVILWQYEKAERLKAIIQYQQDFFDEAVTDFWDSHRDDTFNLDTADSFGLRVWGILLGVDRPSYTRDYPRTVIVSGSGSATADGEYSLAGLDEFQYPYYRNIASSTLLPVVLVTPPTHVITSWFINLDPNITAYYNPVSDEIPPKTGWLVNEGDAPAPTLDYTLIEAFTDDMYRQLLKSRLMLMRMKATIPNINRYVEFLFPDNIVQVEDGLNMTISYRFLKELTTEEQAVLSVDGVLPRPAGVKSIQVIASGETNFGFEGQYREAADPLTQLNNFDNSTFISE